MADARRFGFDDEQIAELCQDLAENPIGEFAGVFLVNRPAVTAFLAGSSQWRTQLTVTREGLRNRAIGLDYQGVRVSLDALRIDVTPKLWADLITMEHAAIAAMNGNGN